MRNWINYAQALSKIARDSNLLEKKAATKEIFGSNLFLASREARFSAPSGNDFPLKTHWAALGAAHEKVGKIPESQMVERVRGVGPPSQPWQGCILTVVLHPPTSHQMGLRRTMPAAYLSLGGILCHGSDLH